MATEQVVIKGANLTGASFYEAISSLPGISNLIRIGQIAGVLVIAYIIFLIVKGFFQFKQTRKMGKLLNEVRVINKKVDKIIKLQGKIVKDNKKSKKRN